MSYFTGLADNIINYATTSELSLVDTTNLSDGTLASVDGGNMYILNKTTVENPSGTNILSAKNGGKWFEYFYATGKNYFTMSDSDNSITFPNVNINEITVNDLTADTITASTSITCPNGYIQTRLLTMGSQSIGGPGEIDMYSFTPSMGRFSIWCEDITANKVVLLNNSNVSGNRTYVLPDPASGTTTSVSSNIVLDKGDMTIAGNKTFSGTTTIASGTIGSTSAAQIQGYSPTNYQTGTTYTLALSDAGKRVNLSNASPITLTIPTTASVAFPNETEIFLTQSGAGQVTIAAAGGVTIQSYQSKVLIAGQYAAATLKKTSTANTWLLIGNLA